MARPTALTPAVSKIVLKAVEQGLPMAAAADLAGVAPSTLYAWRKRGEGEAAEATFSEFSEGLARARAKAMSAALGQIQKAGAGGDWRAAAWLLERRFPRLFAVDVTRELSSMLEELRAKLTPEAFEGVRAALAEQQTSRAGEEG